VAGEKPIRFVAKGLVSLRRRLGLSAAELARLLGVSTQSIYHWEHKKTTPRKAQVAAIVALRSIGRTEAQERLQTKRPAAKHAKRPTAKQARRRRKAPGKPSRARARKRART
jgi:transcriptional regulator with XRE-family HTH domain